MTTTSISLEHSQKCQIDHLHPYIYQIPKNLVKIDPVFAEIIGRIKPIFNDSPFQ